MSERRCKYELTFWGGCSLRYRRWHLTYESAREKALEVLGKMDNAAAHPAIIYGPDLNKDGVTIR